MRPRSRLVFDGDGEVEMEQRDEQLGEGDSAKPTITPVEQVVATMATTRDASRSTTSLGPYLRRWRMAPGSISL